MHCDTDKYNEINNVVQPTNRAYQIRLFPWMSSLLHSRFQCRHATLLPTNYQQYYQQFSSGALAVYSQAPLIRTLKGHRKKMSVLKGCSLLSQCSSLDYLGLQRSVLEIQQDEEKLKTVLFITRLMPKQSEFSLINCDEPIKNAEKLVKEYCLPRQMS